MKNNFKKNSIIYYIMGIKSSKIEPISLNKKIGLEMSRQERTGSTFYLYEFFNHPSFLKQSSYSKK